MKKIALVYQAGIGNVFDITAAPKRILQSTFASCAYLCHGARYAGAAVELYACNRAGDVLLWRDEWIALTKENKDKFPFSENFLIL
jgi:hypothetical protein